jgi:hypothetical protein
MTPVFATPLTPHLRVQAIKDIYGDGYMERRWPPGLTGCDMNRSL